MNDEPALYDWLLQNVSYNEYTGKCHWLTTNRGNGKRGRKHDIGDTFGYTGNDGYLTINLDCCGFKKYQIHRIIWLMQTGTWPCHVDHINHIRLDNTWSNLRDVTKSQNGMNKRKMITNTTGIIGVCIAKWVKDRPYYKAEIKTNGVQQSKYSYNLEECIEWRRLKVKEQHKEFAPLSYC